MAEELYIIVIGVVVVSVLMVHLGIGLWASIDNHRRAEELHNRSVEIEQDKQEYRRNLEKNRDGT